MKKITQYLCLIIAFFCISCGEATGDLVGLNLTNPYGGNNNPVGGTKIIKKIATPQRTMDFALQNSKIVKITTSGNSSEYNLSYNANNKISKVTGFIVDPNTSATTNFDVDFIYNTSGTLTGLEGTETQSGTQINFTTTFTYTSGKLTKTYTERPTAAGISYTENTLTYSGNNITQSSFESGMIMGGTPTTMVTTLTNYSNHDNKVNYLTGIPKEYAAFTTYNTMGLDYFSINNYQNIEVIMNATTISNNTLSFVYDAANYPTSSTTNGATTTYEYQAW